MGRYIRIQFAVRFNIKVGLQVKSSNRPIFVLLMTNRTILNKRNTKRQLLKSTLVDYNYINNNLQVCKLAPVCCGVTPHSANLQPTLTEAHGGTHTRMPIKRWQASDAVLIVRSIFLKQMTTRGTTPDITRSAEDTKRSVANYPTGVLSGQHRPVGCPLRLSKAVTGRVRCRSTRDARLRYAPDRKRAHRLSSWVDLARVQ